MSDLREATRQTVHLAVLEAHEVVYVEILGSPGGPPMPSQVCGRLPVHVTGVGKAILAFSPPETVRGVLESGRVPAPGLLARELVTIRRQGVAYDRDTSREPGSFAPPVPSSARTARRSAPSRCPGGRRACASRPSTPPPWRSPAPSAAAPGPPEGARRRQTAECSGLASGHVMLRPPSTTRLWPVTCSARPDDRNSTAAAMWDGDASRPSGVRAELSRIASA